MRTASRRSLQNLEDPLDVEALDVDHARDQSLKDPFPPLKGNELDDPW